jgi:preprotein translocase subunit SecE
MLSAIGAGVIIITGAGWLWAELAVIKDDTVRTIVQTVCALAIVLGGGGILYWLLNKPRIVEFLIATEIEMRKVNWPTRSELIKETWIVIAGTILMFTVLMGIDVMFFQLFRFIGILQTG